MRVIFFIISIGAGLNLPSILAIITAIVRKEDWGKALAVQQVGPPLSLITGPLFCAILLSYFSWRIPLLCIAILTLMVGLFLVRFGKFGDFPGDAPNTSHVKSIVSLRSFWIMILLFAVGIGGQIGVYSMMPLYLVAEKGMNTETTNTLIGLSQISALFMTFFSGWVTDRIGEKKAIALFLVISGLMTVLLGITSGTLLKVTIFLQPAITVCYFPPGFAALSRIAQPPIRSLVAAWAAPLAFFLGGGLFPAALAYMGQTLSFSLGLTLAGIVISAGAILVIFLKLLDTVDDGC
jgi:NNP family nitrate/nitrite transporter-like MFS transporter